jgi:hypothetical protein
MEMLSLYDYLGKAAGEELGKEVAKAAAEAGIKRETREVSNSKYEGKVYLYPKDFLDFHFRDPESYQIEDALPKGHDWTGNLEDDELPF